MSRCWADILSYCWRENKRSVYLFSRDSKAHSNRRALNPSRSSRRMRAQPGARAPCSTRALFIRRSSAPTRDCARNQTCSWENPQGWFSVIFKCLKRVGATQLVHLEEEEMRRQDCNQAFNVNTAFINPHFVLGRFCPDFLSPPRSCCSVCSSRCSSGSHLPPQKEV